MPSTMESSYTATKVSEKCDSCINVPKQLEITPSDGENSNNGGNNLTKSACSRIQWTPLEDAKLKELVATHGPQNWHIIAQGLDGRSGSSCRLRWSNQLDPNINKSAFSEEEEERLVEAQRVHGNKWALISKSIPGRTDNALRNHWHVMMRRGQKRKSLSDVAQDLGSNPYSGFDENSFNPMRESRNYMYYYPSNDHISYSQQQVSTSHVSFAEPSQAPPLEEQNATPPKFIDFLGVGKK